MNNDYFNHVKSIFNDEYDAYIESLSQPFHKSISFNLSKATKESLVDLLPFPVRYSPFNTSSGLIEQDIHVSDYALYHCGVFYAQEASASSVVDLLDLKQGDVVLDACAAPGGKSFQIANKIGNQGYLISNEFEANRASLLARNIKYYGFDQCIVTNNDTADLKHIFKHCFDKVLVDAPCSGEGMIKKNDIALTQWSYDYVLQCQQRQLSILDNLKGTLKENGILVYSTCTFSLEENEQVIAQFLKTNPDFGLEEINVTWGRKGFDIDSTIDLTKTRRIFPMDGGEGHFMAKLRYIGKNDEHKFLKTLDNSKLSNNQLQQIQQCHVKLPSYYQLKDNVVYSASHPILDCKGLKVIYHDCQFGEFKEKRFEPCFESSRVACYKPLHQSIAINITQVNQILKGESIELNGIDKGWYCLNYHGIDFTWTKFDGRYGKNKYIKPLRINYDVI